MSLPGCSIDGTRWICQVKGAGGCQGQGRVKRGEEMDLCKQNFTEVNLKQQLISTSTEYPLLPTTPPVSMLTATTAALVTRDNIWPGIKRSSVLRLSVDSLMWILFKCVVKSDEFKTAVDWSGCYQTPLTPEMKLNELKAALTSCHVMVSQQQLGWHVSWSLEATQVFLIRCCCCCCCCGPDKTYLCPCRGIITSSTWTPHTALTLPPAQYMGKTWSLQSSFK